MANRVPLHIEVPLDDFDASVRVPLDMNATEAWSIAAVILAQSEDPSAAAKYAVCDPSVYPEIVE